jgi:hypothetical protein
MAIPEGLDRARAFSTRLSEQKRFSRMIVAKRLRPTVAATQQQSVNSPKLPRSALCEIDQINRATKGIFRNSSVKPQLMLRVPVNTIANLMPAGSGGS